MAPTRDCPLCERRAARRECPALGRRICSVCCGTKREVEIDCPADCVHLTRGRRWEEQHPASGSRAPRIDTSGLLERHGPPISALVAEIVAERASTPSLVDGDVIAALEALRVTLRTLDAGIYYETRPEGLAAGVLYRRLVGLLNQWMAPGGSGGPVLRTSDAKRVVDFLVSAGEAHAGARRRSRRFLDWMSSLGVPETGGAAPGGLIIP